MTSDLRVRFGMDPCTADYESESEAPQRDPDVDTLASLLGNYTNSEKVVFTHQCVLFAAKSGMSQQHTESEHVMLQMKTLQKETCDQYNDPNIPHWVVVLAEAGKKPFGPDKNGVNEIVASHSYFSGVGFYSIANLRVEMINDQTKSGLLGSKNPLAGDGGFVTNYKTTMWNKLLSGADANYPGVPADDAGTPEVPADTGNNFMNMNEGMVGVTFDDFLVRKITIRYMSFSEILSDIGGLWAAAFLILGFVWKKSGYLSVTKSGSAGDEMYIFKYLPDKTRDSMLLGKTAAPEESSTSADDRT